LSWLGVSNRSISQGGAPDSGSAALVEGADSAVGVGGNSSGATQVFSFANFSAAPSTIQLTNANYSGSNILMISNHPNHASASAWFKTQQPANSFTTQFTFQPQNMGSSQQPVGISFGIQNTVSPPAQASPPLNGTSFSGDANTCGYCAGYSGLDQYPPYCSMMVKFDAGSQAIQQSYPVGTLPSSTGMYFNGGPSVENGKSLELVPFNDLRPYGINFYNGSSFQVTIVYDGSLLTMVILDLTTAAQARFVWPLNLSATVSPSNWVGFNAGTGSSATAFFNILNWTYWSGFNARLATPTMSPAPGNYTGTQSVTISGSGTIYYTTDGTLPTSASTLYTGAISVTANQVIQSVAIQSGSTDSLIAAGNYVIGTSSNTINFPSGFVAGNLIPVGMGALVGSAYVPYPVTGTSGTGACWFPLPVTVSSFSTTFRFGVGPVMCFVLQNNPPAYTGLTNVQVTGSGGQISFDSNSVVALNPLLSQYVTITGTPGGGTGLTAGIYFLASATSTTATLQTPSASTQNTGNAITTTAGTPTGLTFSVNTPNSSAGGPTSVGSSQDAYGYGGLNASNNTGNTVASAFGLANSVALVFNPSSAGGDPANCVGLYQNGYNPYGAGIATGLTLTGSDNIATLTYSGTTLALSLQKASGGTVFTQNWTTNIPGIVGGNTAYVGFQSGNFGASAAATLVNWTY
jgi:hypothetical protein